MKMDFEPTIMETASR